MSKQEHQEGSAHLIIFIFSTVLIIGSLGFVFWMNYISSQNSAIDNSSLDVSKKTASSTTNTATEKQAETSKGNSQAKDVDYSCPDCISYDDPNVEINDEFLRKIINKYVVTTPLVYQSDYGYIYQDITTQAMDGLFKQHLALKQYKKDMYERFIAPDTFVYPPDRFMVNISMVNQSYEDLFGPTLVYNKISESVVNCASPSLKIEDSSSVIYYETQCGGTTGAPEDFYVISKYQKNDSGLKVYIKPIFFSSINGLSAYTDSKRQNLISNWTNGESFAGSEVTAENLSDSLDEYKFTFEINSSLNDYYLVSIEKI